MTSEKIPEFPIADDTSEFVDAKVAYVRAYDRVQKALGNPGLYIMLLISLVIFSFSVAFGVEGLPLDWLGVAGVLETDALLLLTPILCIYVNVRYFLKIRKHKTMPDDLIQSEKRLNELVGHEVLGFGGAMKDVYSRVKLLIIPADIVAGVLAVYSCLRAILWLSIPRTLDLYIVYICLWIIFTIGFLLIEKAVALVPKIAIYIAKRFPVLRYLTDLIDEFIQYSEVEDYEKKTDGLSDKPVYFNHKNILRHFKKLEGDQTDSPSDRTFEVLVLAYLNSHETGNVMYKLWGAFFASLIGTLTFVTELMGSQYALIILFPFIAVIVVHIQLQNFGIRKILSGYNYSIAVRLNYICGKDILLADILELVEESTFISRIKAEKKIKHPTWMIDQKLGVPIYILTLIFVLICIAIGAPYAIATIPVFGYLFVILSITTPLYLIWVVRWMNYTVREHNKLAKERIQSFPGEYFGVHTDHVDQAYLGSYTYYRQQNQVMMFRALFLVFLALFFICIIWLNVANLLQGVVEFQILNGLYLFLGLFALLLYYYSIDIHGRQVITVGRRIEKYLKEPDLFTPEEEEKTKFLATKPKKAILVYLIPIILTVGGQYVVFYSLPWYICLGWALALVLFILYAALRLVNVRRYLARDEIKEYMDFPPVKSITEPVPEWEK